MSKVFGVQGSHQSEYAPVSPFLHYHDPADKEESCPQPSALLAALAACRPGTGRPQASTLCRFHLHPALPPHPLLKLLRPASRSPTQQGSGPALAADSPPQQNTADDSCNLMGRHESTGGSAHKDTSYDGLNRQPFWDGPTLSCWLPA